MAKIYQVDFKERTYKRVQKEFMYSVWKTLENESEMTGFAIVCWDKRGRSTVSMNSEHSPIPHRMIPNHVMQALQGYIYVDDAVYAVTGDNLPEDPGAA